MENNETAAQQTVPAPQPQATVLAACYAGTCRFNHGGVCNILGLEIGKSGRCLNYEERTPEKLRAYLEERGLPPKAIEQIMREAANGGTD